VSRQERIVLLDGFTLNPGDLDWSGFEALGTLEVFDRTSSDKIVERIGDAAIVVTNKTPIDSKVLDACPNIRYIGVLATGYNVVDVAAASARGIVVTNIPTYGTTAVAQYVFALLLELCHHVGEHSKAVKAGRWAASEDFCFWDYPLIELAGKTMGIIGLGRIGRSTAMHTRTRVRRPRESSMPNSTMCCGMPMSSVSIARLPTRPKEWSIGNPFPV